MIYKLYTTLFGQNGATTVGVNPQISFIFAPDNTDYAQFKKAISEETAQLQDSDGVIMSSEDAKQFVSTLP